jgi:hypothetical protein
MQIKSIPTKPVEGQKTGTSGLRKKASTSCFMFHDLAPISDTLFFFGCVQFPSYIFFWCSFQVKVFQQENYLANWIQVCHILLDVARQ